MSEDSRANKDKSQKKGKIKRSAKIAYERARQAGVKILSKPGEILGKSGEIIEKNEKLQKLNKTVNQVAQNDKVKKVKAKVDKVNDLVQPVNDMHNFLLIDAPYVTGQAGMAYEMAFFVSYGTARAKSRIRKVRNKKLNKDKQAE